MSIVGTIGLGWRSLRNHLADLLFPPRCLGCRRVDTWLCADCLGQIPRIEPPFCTRCGDRVEGGEICARCQTSPLHISRIRSVAHFEGTVRHAMHHLKYRGHTALAEPLGGLLATYWARHPAPVDAVVPVPLHAARLRERGYNQAALLAREMARRLGLAVDERTLVRERPTAPQVGLTASQRKDNVHDAFRCLNDALVGKQVLLIDDVCTTGATLEACTLALQRKGACSVQALTLARAR